MLMSDVSGTTEPQASGRQLALQRIYLKDVSFESPASPQVFSRPWQPQVRIEVSTQATSLPDERYEVAITLTLTAQQEQRTVLLIELQQAGLFWITGLDGGSLAHVLHVTCPTILFPYVRETLDSLALRGSFPPLLLAPIDFGALHRQHPPQPSPESPAQ